MKNWITLVAIAVSFALVAQHGGGKSKGNKGGGQGGNKGNPGVKMHPGNAKGNKMPSHPGVKTHPGNNKGFNGPSHNNGKAKPGNHNGYKMPKQKGYSNYGKGKPMYKSKYNYKKGHANHVYMYAYTPFFYPTRNYGQWRSQQARNKHKSYPVALELNVLHGVLMIQERNAFVLLEIDRKIERYHTLVIERHRAGLITDVQFSIHLTNVKKMKKRRGYYSY